MIVESTFKPAWWLPSPHAQTIYPTIIRAKTPEISQSEKVELSDGDFVELAWLDKGLDHNAPIVLLLHGLGGGLNSAYVPRLLSAFHRMGWRAALMIFRGAGSEINRTTRAYHSGDTGDLKEVLAHLNQKHPNAKRAVVGISLGGNVLLKYLGEHGSAANIDVGVAVSVPFELRVVADKINQGLSRLYQAYLLRSVRELFLKKYVHSSEEMPFSKENLESARCFWTFDEYVTAPVHGFSNVHSYYREASSRPYLVSIKKPVLILHARDDPFMTPEAIPKEQELSQDVLFELSPSGGHVGFVTSSTLGKPEFWLDERIPNYLNPYLSP